MPEYTHNTNTGFDLRYPRKNAIKLEPHSCTCIDLKIALEILATTMIQLASRNNLVKKEINIRRGIIDAGYLVLVRNREELKMTARKINEFGSISRINIPVNITEEKPQIFEAEATICELRGIIITNLYIPAKNNKNIKIPIHNTTENPIEIPKRTIIGYLNTEVKDQLPSTIPDFLQLCRYVDITSQTIYE
ncbi:hypothetical protein G9A89_020399 [Geosiphon pyriformis]|nr:hypothetical protein G9A89_020399 [Geosiphon pyriformis]